MWLLTLIYTSYAFIEPDFQIAKEGIKKIPFLHHVHNLKITKLQPPPSHLKNALDNEIKVTFEAGDHKFDCHLKLFEHLYAPDGKSIHGNPDFSQTELPRNFHSYIGTAKIYPAKSYFPNFKQKKQQKPRSKFHDLFRKIFGKSPNSKGDEEEEEEEEGDPWENDKDGFHIPGKVSLTFHDPQNQQFGATIFAPNELFNIDPEHHHEDHLVKNARGKNHNLKMYMRRDSDIIRNDGEFPSKFHQQYAELEKKEKETTPWSLYKKHQDFKNIFWGGKLNPENEDTKRIGRKLQQRVYFTDCYPKQTNAKLQTHKVGLLLDKGFINHTGTGKKGGTLTTADAVVAKYFTDTNALYEPQMEASQQIGDRYSGTQLVNPGIPTTLDVEKVEPFVDGRTSKCTDKNAQGAATPLTPGDRLYKLRDWRNNHYQTNKDTNAIFHLLTSCHPEPGTVGIAFIGVLCHTRYGVGLTSTLIYQPVSNTWKTYAHEVGHNYGANHSFENGQGRTGGIMDYGDGLFQGVFQFNPLRKTEVCGHLTNVIATTNSPSYNIAPNSCWTARDKSNPVATVSYSWKLSSPLRYTTCSRSCGTGSQLPVYVCIQKTDPPGSETQVADSNCNNASKPTGNPRNCNTNPCSTRSPTPQPTTPKPTKRPTKRPTPKPTTPKPTKGPTPGPTTPKPTKRPTNNPSNSPTRPPTKRPTKIPTRQPTRRPSFAPTTKSPTANPVPGPVPPPTKRPTDSPTISVAAAACGNGKIDRTELCDSQVGNGAACCQNQCTLWSTTKECRATNQFVDAAFMDASRRIYLFLGEYYVRYPAPQAGQDYPTTPEAGYPRAIAATFSSWPYTSGLSAIVRAPDNILWVFQGFKFFKYDLDQEAIIAPTRDARTEFSLPNDFRDCGDIDSAISLLTKVLLICDDKYVIFDYGSRYAGSASFPLNHLGNVFAERDFPSTRIHQNRFSAAFQDPVSSKIRVYAADKHSQYLPGAALDRGYPADTRSIWAHVKGVPPGSSECRDANCETCLGDGLTCQACKTGFYKFINGQCLSLDVIISLIFNSRAEDAAFSEMPTGASYTTGQAGGGAIVLSQSTKIQGKPVTSHDPSQSTVVTDFEVSAWYKPVYENDEVPERARFFTVTNPTNPKPKEECDKIEVDFVHHCKSAINQDSCEKAPRTESCFWDTTKDKCLYKNCKNAPKVGNEAQDKASCEAHLGGSKCEWIDPNATNSGATQTNGGAKYCGWKADVEKTRETFEIGAYYCGQTIKCYVKTAVEVNKWNKIHLKFKQNVFTTQVGALKHQLAIQTNADDHGYTIDWSKATWYVGNSDDTGNASNGIAGHLDSFQVSRISQSEDGADAARSSSSSEEAISTTAMLGIVVGGIAFMIIAFLLVYKRYYGKFPCSGKAGCSCSCLERKRSLTRRLSKSETSLAELHQLSPTQEQVWPPPALSDVIVKSSKMPLPPRPPKPSAQLPKKPTWRTTHTSTTSTSTTSTYGEREGEPLSESSRSSRSSSIVPTKAAPKRPPPPPIDRPRGASRSKKTPVPPPVVKNFRAMPPRPKTKTAMPPRPKPKAKPMLPPKPKKNTPGASSNKPAPAPPKNDFKSRLAMFENISL